MPAGGEDGSGVEEMLLVGMGAGVGSWSLLHAGCVPLAKGLAAHDEEAASWLSNLLCGLLARKAKKLRVRRGERVIMVLLSILFR